MMVSQCYKCIHESVCKHTEWAKAQQSDMTGKPSFEEFANRGFRVSIVFDCTNFHDSVPKKVVESPKVITNITEEPYMTIGEAAFALGMSYNDVRKMVLSGEIKATKNRLQGNRWQIPTSEIERKKIA